MPADCSREAAAISATMSETFFTEATISSSVWPDWVTRAEPSSTLRTESWMSPLISLAAVAERPARLRTSLATTAKPRPCSPARAASTAAFSASRLVWKAISSITPMMSAIFLEDCLMSAMAATAWFTTTPPRSAWSRAARASWLAWAALSAFCLTVVVISSIEEAVSSSDADCSSVRRERLPLPVEISSAERFTSVAVDFDAADDAGHALEERIDALGHGAQLRDCRCAHRAGA